MQLDGLEHPPYRHENVSVPWRADRQEGVSYDRLRRASVATALTAPLTVMKENVVFNRSGVFAIAAMLMAVSVSGSQYPMLDMIAQKVVQKYEQATCEQLWQQRGEPKTAEQQSMIQMLQGDPQMRAVFIDEVAAPIANKMFTCGLIP